MIMVSSRSSQTSIRSAKVVSGKSRASGKVSRGKVISYKTSSKKSPRTKHFEDWTTINGIKVVEFKNDLKHVSKWNNYKRSHYMEYINNPNAKDPTWKKLDKFLSTNVTWNQITKKVYRSGEFMCGDFALALHNNAEAAGIKCGCVGIAVKGRSCGHEINIFNTTDYGWTFVDPTCKIILSKKNFFDQGRDYTFDYSSPHKDVTKSQILEILRDYFRGGLELLVEITW